MTYPKATVQLTKQDVENVFSIIIDDDVWARDFAGTYPGDQVTHVAIYALFAEQVGDMLAAQDPDAPDPHTIFGGPE